MEIESAQLELRKAYLRGGPGAIVSGLVWLTAGVVSRVYGIRIGFAVLFFGGMLIFPTAAFIVRTLLRRVPESKTNPGGLTVIETVFPMIAGLFAAWLFMPFRPEFVFPLSAMAVGSHYFGFRTAYGDWTNWGLGGVLCVVSVLSIIVKVPSADVLPFVVACVEMAFGAWLVLQSHTKDK